MATIKYIKTPDGVTHNVGGGGTVVTYSISLGAVSSNTVPIILTGSNGTTDTVYIKGGGDATMSVSGDTMTITATSGQTITYTLSGSGTTTTYTITNTPSSGTASSVTIPAATTTDAGVMTAADKAKLNGIASGAEVNVQSDWNQADSSADDYIKNKPTIPTVNDATLTIQKNGTTIDTFTANSNTNTTVNVTVPTATSDLTNNSNFVSDASYVHTDNNFTNADVSKLSGIESGAEVNVQANWNEADSSSDAYIQNKPTIPPAITVDSAISSSSTNPVENQAIYTALLGKADDNKFVIDTITGSQLTLNAGATGYAFINCAKTGYKPVGLLQNDTNANGATQNWVLLWSWTFSPTDVGYTDDYLKLSYRNFATQQAKVTPTVTVLYLKQ